MKYFEAGHTLNQAADAFHKEIEDEMKRVGNVYDFSDFEKVIIALKMNVSDFRDYEGRCSHRPASYPFLLYWVYSEIDFNFLFGLGVGSAGGFRCWYIPVCLQTKWENGYFQSSLKVQTLRVFSG